MTHKRDNRYVPLEPVRMWLQELVDRGWTRTEIAREVGMSDRHVRSILNNRPRGSRSTGEWIKLDSADRVAIATGHWLGEIDLDAA